MAEEDRSFSPTEAEANRGRQQGLGVGQREMDAQRDPSREQHAVDPNRPEPFDTDLEPSRGDIDDRNASGLSDAGDLGAGTPANVDIHKLGQNDHPEQDWGEPAGEGAMHSANHTRRGVKTEADRGQGAKTRQANKDAISRRT
jgi:hypothetical protein